MATNSSAMMSFEFHEGGRMVGRATWLGPGIVELDFQDARLRQQFGEWLWRPQAHHGLMFEAGGDPTFWPDESRVRFAEACWSMSHLYQVRRVK